MHERRQPVPSRTNQLIVLDPAECRQLLLQQKIGRIAVTISGQPHVVPVTYAADEDGNVVFRTGPDTVLTRVDLELVAFEIDGVDERTKSGWSVCVHGFGREITGDDDQIARHLRQKLGASWAPCRDRGGSQSLHANSPGVVCNLRNHLTTRAGSPGFRGPERHHRGTAPDRTREELHERVYRARGGESERRHHDQHRRPREG
jgi:uncharacterized protein